MPLKKPKSPAKKMKPRPKFKKSAVTEDVIKKTTKKPKRKK